MRLAWDSPRLHRIGGALVLLLLLLLCADSVRGGDGDHRGYVIVGEIVLAGGDPYADAPPGICTWPPVFTVLCVPLALLDRLSPWLGRSLWLLLILLALLAVLRLLARAVHGRTLVLDPGVGPGLALFSAPVLVPLAMTQAAVIGNFIHLQVNVLVFALVLAGLCAQARGRPALGGLALGVAAAVRVMPLVVVPYLLWRRRWRAAGVTAATCAVVTLLPALVFGWARFTALLEAWVRLAQDPGSWGVGHMNQSLTAMWDRFLGHGVIPFVTAPTHALAVSGDGSVRIAVWATLGLAAVAALWRFRGPQRADGPLALVEWSIVLLVGAVGGPVTWKAYLIVLLLPFGLCYALWRDAARPPAVRHVAAWVLAVGLVCTTLPTMDLVGKRIARHLEMASVYTIGVILVVAGLFVLHARLARSSA